MNERCIILNCTTERFQCKLVAFDKNKIKLFAFNFRSFYTIIISTINNYCGERSERSEQSERASVARSSFLTHIRVILKNTKIRIYRAKFFWKIFCLFFLSLFSRIYGRPKHHLIHFPVQSHVTFSFLLNISRPASGDMVAYIWNWWLRALLLTREEQRRSKEF